MRLKFFSGEFLQEGVSRYNRDAVPVNQIEQMTVTGDNYICFGCQGSFENSVVVGVGSDDRKASVRADEREGISQQSDDFVYLRFFKAELRSQQNLLDFFQDIGRDTVGYGSVKSRVHDDI